MGHKTCKIDENKEKLGGKIMLKAIRKRLNKKGFTLVELIVVIAVLGILATVAVPRLGGITSDAKKAADDANIKMIQNAVELYHAENGELPDDETKMSALVAKYLSNGVPETQENSGYKFFMDSDGKVDIKVSTTSDETEVK